MNITISYFIAFHKKIRMFFALIYLWFRIIRTKLNTRQNGIYTEGSTTNLQNCCNSRVFPKENIYGRDGMNICKSFTLMYNPTAASRYNRQNTAFSTFSNNNSNINYHKII